MNVLESFPMHKGARGALYFAAFLCILIIIASPLGIWMILRARKGRVDFVPGGLNAYGMTTTRLVYADVERIGVMKVPVLARGLLGRWLVHKKLGGAREASNLVARTRTGKKLRILLNQFRDPERILSKVTAEVGKPMEEVPMGALGPRWSDAPPA